MLPSTLEACLVAAREETDAVRRAAAIDALRCWLGREDASLDARILDVLEAACASDPERDAPARAAAAGVLRRALMRPGHRLVDAVSGRAWVWDGLDLQGVRLAGADLRGSSMRGARLEGAFLHGAVLDGVDACRADMNGAVLARTSWVGAECDGANLRWADMSEAVLASALFNAVNLDGAVLDGARAEGVFLSDAIMTHASLAKANLGGANLFGARLNGARMDGADFRGTGLTPERIARAGWRVHASRTTRWGNIEDRDGRNPLCVESGRVPANL